MITDATELQRMADFARLAKSKGFSPQQVDAALREKGSSLADAAEVIKYGADTVAKSRTTANGYDNGLNPELQSTLRRDAGNVMDAAARGIPVLGGLYNKYNAAWDASTEYLLGKVGANVPQKTDGTSATWRERYNRALEHENVKEKEFASARPGLNLAANLLGGAIVPVGAGTKAASLGGALKSGALMGAGLGAADAFVRSDGNLGAAAIGGGLGAPLGALGGAAGLGATKLADTIAKFARTSGFRKQLNNVAAGHAVADVNFGKATPETIAAVNSVPGLAENAVMKDGKIIIPAKNVEHIYNQRIVGNKMSIDDVVNTADNVFYGAHNNISASGNPNSVMFANADAPSGYGFVVPNNNNSGQNTIETVIKAYPQKINKVVERNASRLGGHDVPPSSSGDAGRSSRFSALQSADSDMVTQNATDVKNALSPKQMKMLAEHVGGNDILQALIAGAREKNLSLAEMGDPSIATMITKANLTSPAARRSIIDAQSRHVSSAAAERENVFADTLGQRVGIQDIENLKTEARKGAAELYNKAWKHNLTGQDILELNGNSLIRKAVTDVNKKPGEMFGGRAKIEPQSVQYWDGVKREIDNKIAAEYAKAEPDMGAIANWEEARSELVKKLDKVAPTYRYGRDIYSSGYDIDDAYNLGKKVLWNNDTSDFITKVKEIRGNTTNNNAFKMGVRQAIEEKIGSPRGDNVFKDVLTPNAQKKLKTLLGEKDGQKLIDFAEKQFNWKQTINKALANSPTAEREKLAEEAVSALGTLANSGSVVNAAGKIAGKALLKGAKALGRATDEANYDAIVRAIMNPARDLQMTPSTAQAARDNATNAILRALGMGANVAGRVGGVLPTVQPRATGALNQAIINALNGGNK